MEIKRKNIKDASNRLEEMLSIILERKGRTMGKKMKLTELRESYLGGINNATLWKWRNEFNETGLTESAVKTLRPLFESEGLNVCYLNDPTEEKLLNLEEKERQSQIMEEIENVVSAGRDNVTLLKVLDGVLRLVNSKQAVQV